MVLWSPCKTGELMNSQHWRPPHRGPGNIPPVASVKPSASDMPGSCPFLHASNLSVHHILKTSALFHTKECHSQAMWDVTLSGKSEKSTHYLKKKKLILNTSKNITKLQLGVHEFPMSFKINSPLNEKSLSPQTNVWPEKEMSFSR